MQTDFAKSAKALREAEIDMSAVDPKSQQILGACFKVMYDSFVNKSESADQVAAFVKNVIPCEKPSVRYQTNPRYGVEEVPAKLLDPSGNKPVQVIEHHFGLWVVTQSNDTRGRLWLTYYTGRTAAILPV